MYHQVTQSEADEHNSHFQRGWALTEGLVLLDDTRVRALTWFGRRRLRKAVAHFEAALAINPMGWQSMWALGKIYQRLGKHQEALDWFERGRRIDPSQSALSREAGLEALAVRDPVRAIEYFRAALREKPDDFGLVSNLALAQLLAGFVDEAKGTVAQAVAGDPEDRVARAVQPAIDRVRTGGKRLPATVEDVQRLAK